MAIAMCGAAFGAIATSPAVAQTEPASALASRKHRFDIAAGPLGAALNAWSRVSGRSIVFRSEDVASLKTEGARGWLTDAAALDRVLRGTGFGATTGAGGAVAISRLAGGSPDDQVGGATPEILVTAPGSMSLNTGIKRSQDDSQPFIVLTGEEIRRSGAPNLESYLRDQLSVNATAGTSEQVTPTSTLPGELPANRGLSRINLRGLGARDTLILVDGRRQPGINLGDGDISQPSITGIPLSSIERIEVLASSASGIYGSGASGGVINIVLRRDISGGEITANYSNTSDFKMGQGRIDLTYGMPIEGGRTNIAFSGSWQKGLPLLYGDREKLRAARRAEYARNSDDLAENSLGVPLGTTVNFQNIALDPLKLKAQYGGQTLASRFGSVPVGYKGVAADGIGPLLANIGTYNRETPDTAFSPGLRAPLIFGSDMLNGSLTVRREFSSWLTG